MTADWLCPDCGSGQTLVSFNFDPRKKKFVRWSCPRCKTSWEENIPPSVRYERVPDAVTGTTDFRPIRL